MVNKLCISTAGKYILDKYTSLSRVMKVKDMIIKHINLKGFDRGYLE